MKEFKNITEKQLQTKGVSALSDRPNASAQYGVGGLSPAQLKRWFDNLAIFLAEKINAIHDALSSTEAASYIRVALDDYEVTSLDELVEAIINGNLAKNILQVLPNFNAYKSVSLQKWIFDITELMNTYFTNAYCDYSGEEEALVFETGDGVTVRVPLRGINKGVYNYVDSRVAILNKRTTTLEEAVYGDLAKEVEDNTASYQKEVPEKSLSYAEIVSVGNDVTAIKSLGGNKVLDYEELTEKPKATMTVTNLGGGRLQFDGYTSYQDNDWDPGTNQFRYYTFLSVPLKPGAYMISGRYISGSDLGDHPSGMIVNINGDDIPWGFVTIAEDTTVEFKLYVATGSAGFIETVFDFEIFKYNDGFTEREVIDTLAVPLGEDNFIAVEPGGSLVFENEGDKAVQSKVVFHVKDRKSSDTVSVVGASISLVEGS